MLSVPCTCNAGRYYESTNGTTMDEYCKKLAQSGKDGMQVEYTGIVKKDNQEDECTAFKANMSKNRYGDVKCFEFQRVILKDSSSRREYVHANHIQGYQHTNAFIGTQGPIEETLIDFWRMIWQEKCVVIVALTKLIEGGKLKCSQYWPARESKVIKYGNITVQTRQIRTAKNHSYTRSDLKLEHIKTHEIRHVAHLLFLQWPDFGTPSNSQVFLRFLNVCNTAQADMTKEAGWWSGCALGPPMVVHCSAGVGRTGTLVALDILIRQLHETGKIDVPGVVEKIRTQRSSAVQKPDQYIFLNLALVEYAMQNDMIKPDQVDLDKFLGENTLKDLNQQLQALACKEVQQKEEPQAPPQPNMKVEMAQPQTNATQQESKNNVRSNERTNRKSLKKRKSLTDQISRLIAPRKSDDKARSKLGSVAKSKAKKGRKSK